MPELHDLTALEQAAAIRRGEVSPVELTEHYLERTDRLADTVGAFITVTPELAREQARAAERAVRESDDPADLPEIESVVLEYPSSNGPYGVKGVGEMTANSPIPAIVNAIYNATGVRITELPVTPEKILRGLEAKAAG